MDGYLTRQNEIIREIERIVINFSKDSAERKTSEYLEKRISALDALWGEFKHNNQCLMEFEDKSHEYYASNVFNKMSDYYRTERSKLANYTPATAARKPTRPSTPAGGSSRSLFEVPKASTAMQTSRDTHESRELIAQQQTQFRAFVRVTKRINIDGIEEKWEIEDELRELQHRWRVIDDLHLRIDNILMGTNSSYDAEFEFYETMYSNLKRQLNKKLCSTTHLRQSVPQVDIPTFTGKYTQWPTFFDLFTETIHTNTYLSKAQKLQHLKGKLRGEAERLIQHLSVSTENYDTAWELLTHRYNNPQVLFTHQIETFLNQPNIHKQSSFELKRLYDTTMECIHAVHNLGVDTTTWDPILVHLIAKKLDADTYSDYKESRKSPRDLPSFEELMAFIEAKFIALEPISKKERDAAPSKPASTQQTQRFFNPQHPKHAVKNYQAVPTYSSKCPICASNHMLFQCKRFANMNVDTKMRSLAQHGICQNCLYQHKDQLCFSTKRCKKCNAAHNTMIHEAVVLGSNYDTTDMTSDSDSNSTPPATQPKSRPTYDNFNVNHVATDDEEILLTTVSLKIKTADNTFITLRALLDQGSQISLISERAAQVLGLQRQRYYASVSGIGAGPKQSKGMITMECKSIYDDYVFTTQALIITRVINNLPNASFGKQEWSHLQHINLADPEYNVSKPIDLLLDASVYSDIIMGGLIKGPPRAPIAQQTRIGWILSGNVKTVNCHVTLKCEDLSKFWEVEDISTPSSNMTMQDEFCEDFYRATTSRLDDGRYEVALPMKPNYQEQLGSSRMKATAQFHHQEKKLSKTPALSASYKAFIREYKELGHMRLAEHVTERNCYLPHHGVTKLDSTTTALRVVFNASSKTSSGHSLNDLMESGPNLQQDLQSLILKWRMHKYVITADIEKMFRQILIRTADQHLQTILWRDAPDDALQAYHLTTVTYGTKAAPFLAIRTLHQLAYDNAEQYPLAASALLNSFYMDDLMSGHESIDQVKELQLQLITVLQGAGMNLRKWSSNDRDLIKDLPSEQRSTPYEFKDADTRKTLGLKWNPITDSFAFQSKIDHDAQQLSKTKRQLLSDISKIYDPLGWLSPLTIKAKILFQKTWLNEMSWDEELTPDILNEWCQLRRDLQNITLINVPRQLVESKNNLQLHGFSDASENAYACSIYLASEGDKGEFTSRLVAAKTRVAPRNKTTSLPRLELLGALLLSQLIKKVIEAIKEPNVPVFAWTDSMVVLGWLHGDINRWKQFVANRVKTITTTVPASQWRHVPSAENAADCATRGLTTANLLAHSLWWQGPQWLLNFKPGTQAATPEYTAPTIDVVKKVNVNTALQTHSPIIKIIENKSSLARATRIVAWISRFIARRLQQPSPRESYLTSAELQNAQNFIVKCYQTLEYADEINYIKKNGYTRANSKLASLNPFLDQQGILRVGGRLENSRLDYSAKHPVIVPSHSRLAELIINQAHLTTLHGGPRLTLSYTRDQFWIIGGVRTVKRMVRLCVKCRRFNPSSNQQIMADLPSPRVTPARPFTNTGVDFTGHFDIKANKGRGIKTTKGYVAVFVCLVTKAVHIELVSDLSTPAFLAAFKRMCARRGTPSNIYSDNGTNFVGASRLLREEYKAILQTINTDFIKDVSNIGVQWHFNAPAWPSAGGLWEAAVKSMKHHLKRVLGEQKLTYEEFTTLLLQVEACVNSRPLCPLTESPDDFYLTPGHFLVGGPLLSRPQTDPDNTKLPARWQTIQAVNKQLWKAWSREYLQQLQSRSKWRRPIKNLKVDDVVIIKEDNLPPGHWAVGRVTQLHPGPDGNTRVVTLKAHNKIIKRPASKLVLLPINDPTTAATPPASDVTAARGARSAGPRRDSATAAPSLFPDTDL